MTHIGNVLVLAAAGALPALLVAASELARPPRWSLRTNVSGREVPAVLGRALVAGGLLSLLVGVGLAMATWVLWPGRVGGAAAVVLILLGVAGGWDDSRGDEAPRGFAGHLRAGRLTGGVVKILAGGAAGVIAGLLVHPGEPGLAALTALAVPLAANLFNLLDRAPGRTGKVALLFALPLLALGDERWAIASAGTFGALAAVLPSDLDERGMLGDAGANPLGGLVGLGLGVSLGTVPLSVVVAVLLLLNAASERWSFSEVIERTPFLRTIDAIGRK